MEKDLNIQAKSKSFLPHRTFSVCSQIVTFNKESLLNQFVYYSTIFFLDRKTQDFS